LDFQSIIVHTHKYELLVSKVNTSLSRMKRTGIVPRQQTPNRFTQVFGKMKETCPSHIKAYATCVMLSENSESVTKGACEKEFALVKECFRQVRKLR
jgi:hypothetical protein